MEWRELLPLQKNILFASIIADGEITKCYPNSRRKNNSYREHFSLDQLEYRKWKANFFQEILYFRRDNSYLVSKSSHLFTDLYPYFYDQVGNKRIPIELFIFCTLPHFLSILYLDDGSLCISRRFNHTKKLIYLTPHIYLYLQNYPKSELSLLQAHLKMVFGFNFKLSKRPDGHGYILKLSKVNETLDFLKIIKNVTNNCINMKYKYDWGVRLEQEKGKYSEYKDYEIVTSDSDRFKNYSDEEVGKIIYLKKNGSTDKEISIHLKRTYWSIVYKIKELRKDGHL